LQLATQCHTEIGLTLPKPLKPNSRRRTHEQTKNT